MSSSPHAVLKVAAEQGAMSEEERRRLRKRRQIARKTPEQRRKLLQYHRRHNEKDGRVYYCDYCDLFISSTPRCWKAHLASERHMDNFEAYYAMAAHIESLWLKEINEAVGRAQAQAVYRAQQAVAGANATTLLPPMRVGPNIVVGGVIGPHATHHPSASRKT